MEILSHDFMRRGFVAVAVVGAVAPLVGAFVVQRRQALIGDGMGHIAFAGVGIAALVGASARLGALALCLVVVAIMQWLRRTGIATDLVLAIMFYGGIAVGYMATAEAGGAEQIERLLFGSPLTLRWSEVGIAVAASGAVALIVLLAYRPLVAIAFDEESARLDGLHTDRFSAVMSALVAVVVVAAMDALGLLLVAAMMVIPVATGSMLARSYKGTLALSSGFGAFGGIAGLTLSFYADLAPSPSVVVASIMTFMLVAVGGRGRAGGAARGTVST